MSGPYRQQHAREYAREYKVVYREVDVAGSRRAAFSLDPP